MEGCIVSPFFLLVNLSFDVPKFLPFAFIPCSLGLVPRFFQSFLGPHYQSLPSPTSGSYIFCASTPAAMGPVDLHLDRGGDKEKGCYELQGFICKEWGLRVIYCHILLIG